MMIAKRRIVYMLIVVASLSGVIGCVCSSPGEPDTMSGEEEVSRGLNLLIYTQGGVLLKRDGWPDYVPTSFGVDIRRGDLIRPAEGQSATILCADLSLHTVEREGGCPCEVKEPKTSHSRRRVAMTPKLSLFLREYRTEREVLYRELGKKMTLDGLVFAYADGKPVDPSILSHEFARIAKLAGLHGVRFHDLRHTFASLMLLRRAKPKVISEALGHSSVAFTMDVYSHIIEGMQSDAMALLDEVLPIGVNGVKNKITSPNYRQIDAEVSLKSRI